MARGSTARVNSPVDSGHPCLVPLPREKEGESIQFVLTLAEGHLYSNLIQEINLGPKLN